MTFRNSDVKLEGYWKDDVFVGGKARYEDGSEYNGTMRNYEREGQGDYHYLDRSEYSGNWLDGEKSGKGKYKFYNGDVFDGEFERGGRAKGRYIWKDYDYEIIDTVYENERLLEGKIYQGSTQNVVKTINERAIK